MRAEPQRELRGIRGLLGLNGEQRMAPRIAYVGAADLLVECGRLQREDALCGAALDELTRGSRFVLETLEACCTH